MTSALPSRVGKWFWGIVPAGFSAISNAHGRLMVVCDELATHLDPEKFMKQVAPENAESALYGRGSLSLIQMGKGETVVVRPYRHGGLFRHLTGSLFFTWPPRPFVELAVTEEARRRGVPTLEVCGAAVERVFGPLYRGWLITRELVDACDLWAALQKGLYAGAAGKSLLRAVAQSVRQMHRLGIYHRDLNLRNIMVRREGNEIIAYIIDFDKARVFPREVPDEKAQENLRRLLRSIGKLDSERRYLSHEDWELFIRFYGEAAEA